MLRQIPIDHKKGKGKKQEGNKVCILKEHFLKLSKRRKQNFQRRHGKEHVILSREYFHLAK